METREKFQCNGYLQHSPNKIVKTHPLSDCIAVVPLRNHPLLHFVAGLVNTPPPVEKGEEGGCVCVCVFVVVQERFINEIKPKELE